MRKILVDSIKGDEILAKEIYSNLDTILMAKGTTLKTQYIKRLKELNVDYIYVEDELGKGIDEKELIEVQIKEQCQKAVVDTFEKYSYLGNVELVKLQEVAVEIINEILDKPEVMYSISGVRQKSETIYAHSLNVCSLAVLIALRMKLPKKQINDIAIGSILHDIGYNDIPEEIKNMKWQDITAKEEQQIKMHVVTGYSAVKDEEWISAEAKNIILHHHEKIDGSGYPFHLKGDKMSVGLKIVSLCDEFDRMVYGTMMKQSKVHNAIEYIMSLAGKVYELEIAKTFSEAVAAYPIGTLVITNENEIGIVLKQNTKCPTRPLIRMIKDANGNNYTEWVEKNLLNEINIFIKDTIENI